MAYIDTLNSFEPISLDAMSSIQLMDRLEAKYLFPIAQLSEVLELSKQYYKVLEIEKTRILPYKTTYLDTEDFMFFRQHIGRKSKRFKVRYRIYEISDLSFLEVKHKTQNNRTLKWRIKNRLNQPSPDGAAVEFLGEYFDEHAGKLTPVLLNKFKRITLAGLETHERITIDFDIKFSDGVDHKAKLPFLCIAEIKKEGHFADSPFVGILKSLNIHRSGFSKYCVGNAMVREMPKANSLKPTFLKLSKIERQNSSYCLNN